MKVIDGKFGNGPELEPYARLQDQLDRAGLEDAKGQYLLIWDMGDSLMMMSNMDNAGDVYMHCAKAQTAVIATQFEMETDGPGNAS